MSARFGVLVASVMFCLAPAVRAQSSADSAGIVLDAARTLAREGRHDAARQLLRLIQSRWGATPAGRSADSLLGTPGLAGPSILGGSGRTGFILFHTLYGGFLGAAIPAAFGADGTEPYGAGLLLGAPLGFFASRAFARARITMPGQAGIATFATTWGTWQGLAVQQMFDIGEEEFCDTFGCFSNDSETAPWAAMVVGGLAGLGTGLALASRSIRNGTSTLISHSAFWGSWFGVSLGSVLGAEGNGLIGTTLLGGNGALLLAIPAARAWRPSSARVRIITAGGIAGGLAGLGIDLLASVDDEKTALAIPAASSALGLLVGALATNSRRDEDDGDGAGEAFLTVRDGARFGVPLPLPALIPTGAAQGPRWRPGFRILLLHMEF